MKELLKKIQKIKKEVGKITKDSENPFFKSKYTDINSLLEQLEPLLEKEGLILLQPVRDKQVFSEIIDLESEEKIFSAVPLPELTDPQKIGSAITYYRRYTLTGLFALQSEDDDGNLASGKSEIGKTKTKKTSAKKLTMAQGKYLKNLGYKGDLEKMTFEDADAKIKELVGGN